MGTKLLSLLNKQRSTGKFCDVEFELQSGFSAYGHFSVIAPQSDFVGGEHFLQESLKFSIHNPLKIKVHNFSCDECFRKLLDYFYMDVVAITREHEEHFKKLTKLLAVGHLKKLFGLDASESSTKPGVAVDVVVKNVFEEKQNYFKLPSSESQNKFMFCGGCDFKSYKVSATLDHLKTCKHQSLMCCLCDLGFFSSKDFFEHLQKHDDPKPFFCLECEAKFPTKASLSIHKPKHSLKAAFKCSHCSKAFKWKHGLKEHLLSHKQEKQMLCDICGWSATHMKALRAHKRTHTGELFKCSFPGCTHKATRKENLKIHESTHSNERPFVCEVCGCKFSQSKNLKRHALIHSDAGRIRKCQLCSFATHRSDKLKEHMDRVHTERPVQLELSEEISDTFEKDAIDLNNLFNHNEEGGSSTTAGVSKRRTSGRTGKSKQKKGESTSGATVPARLRPIAPKVCLAPSVETLTIDQMVETLLVE